MLTSSETGCRCSYLTVRTDSIASARRHQWAIAWLLPCLLFLSLAQARAAVLIVPEPVLLQPGGYLSQPIGRQEASVRIEISIGEAPEGARLSVEDDGQLVVVWQSDDSLAKTTRIELLVKNVDTGALLESVPLIVRRDGGAEELTTSVGKKGEIVSPKSMAKPIFAPIANQVISVGRVVSIRVAASMPDGSSPNLQIDRLPLLASFDTNEDGSRTFFWRTTEKNEGEHLFRFTAVNPDNADVRIWQEVLVVIGDPSRAKTVPAPAESGESR